MFWYELIIILSGFALYQLFISGGSFYIGENNMHLERAMSCFGILNFFGIIANIFLIIGLSLNDHFHNDPLTFDVPFFNLIFVPFGFMLLCYIGMEFVLSSIKAGTTLTRDALRAVRNWSYTCLIYHCAAFIFLLVSMVVSV